MMNKAAPGAEPQPASGGLEVAEEIFARFLGPKAVARAAEEAPTPGPVPPRMVIEEPPGVPPSPTQPADLPPQLRRRKVLGFVTARGGEGLSTVAHHALVEGDPSERGPAFAQAQAVVDLRLARNDRPGVWLRGGPGDLIGVARFLRALLLTWKLAPARITELVDEDARLDASELTVRQEDERLAAHERAVRVVQAARLARRASTTTRRINDLIRHAAEWRTLRFVGAPHAPAPPFEQAEAALLDAWGSLYADLYELGGLVRELDVGLALQPERPARTTPEAPAAAPEAAEAAEADDWSTACKTWAQEIVASQPSPGAKWTNQSLAAHIIAHWEGRPFEAQPPLRRDADQPGPPSAGSLQKRVSAWRNAAENPLVFPGA